MIDPRNYIPGCASYTKASEISSLQKYLKKGIKKRDEALELPENPEELKKDPLVPEVSELPKGTIGLHDPREVTELPDKSLKIVNPREEVLETHRENIVPAETPELSETVVGLEDNRETALENYRENISVPEADSLVDYRENITDDREVTELPGTRLDINEALIPELPGETIKTPGEVREPGSLDNTKLVTPDSETSHKITVLPDTAVDGPKPQEISLEDHREDIKSNEDPGSLEDYREDLEDKRGVVLEDHKDILEDNRKISLGDHQERLEDRRNISLDPHREDLEDKRDPKLSDHKDTIEDRRNVVLVDHKEELEDRRGITLEGHREDLEDKRSVSLETRKDTIEDKREVGLEDTQLKTPGKQKTPELSGTVISGPEVKEVSLGKSKVTIEDKRGVTLETHRDTIENKRDPKLSDHREDISDKRNPELPGTIIGLTDKRSVSLETRKDTIEDSRNTELPEVRENIDVPGTPSLPTDQVDLKVTSKVDLEDYQEKLKGTPRISELPKFQEEVPGENRDPELDTTKITRPGTDSDVTLPADTDKLEGITDVESLETGRLDITDDREVTLPEGVLPIEGEIPEVSSLEDTRPTRPGETPNLDQIYSDSTNQDLYPLEGVDVSLPDTRLDITNPNEPFLEDEQLPMEPDMSDPGWDGSLEDTVIHDEGDQNPVGWNEALEDERLDIESPDTPELVTIPKIKSEPEDNWTMEPDMSDPGWDESLEDEQIKTPLDKNLEGWDGTLVTVEDIKAEPEDNWTVEPDLNPEGWDGELVTVPDIKAETDDNWTIEPDKNPVGWDETLVTVDDIIAEPEDNWTVEPDKNKVGWDGTLVTVEDIKAEPEDNWTIEPDKNPEKPGESTDINVILGLETEAIKIAPHINEEPMDPDHAQKFVDTTHNHSFKKDIDGVSSSIESEFSEGTVMSLEEYGKETEKPKIRPNHVDPEYTEDPGWKHIDTPSMSQGDFNEYNKNVKITPHVIEESADPDHAQRQRLVDLSRNHSFKKGSDGISSSIESGFSDTTELEKYGKETEKPKIRPDHTDPKQTEDLNWKHIDTPSMSQEDFKDYTESSNRDDLLKESNTETYISRENGSQLNTYGAKTSAATKVIQDSRSYMETPEKAENTLKEAFNWSSENMGRSGWHVDDLAIPAYKLGGSFTSFLNPSKYLRFAVENTVGAIPLKGSLKQWILDEALAGLIAARDKLEESLNLQPWRLPGSDEYAIKLLRQGMSGVDLGDAKNFVGNSAANLLSSGGAIIKNPINRPGKTDKTKGGQEYRWEGMTKFQSKDGHNVADLVQSKTDETNKKIISKALGSNQGLKDYSPSYLGDTSGGVSWTSKIGMAGTLNNLALQGTTEMKSFDELRTALENSPYVTTSSRIYGKSSGTIHRHDIAMTLDSNHIWEIIFEPYLGPENGDKSFLPSIQQINYENYLGFGINTNWDTWIPFTSFELNSKKMVQKNLGLYSGEISIPQNLEFTNELRLVICDDQYKSWKRYFDNVMYASTYLCEVHDRDYYTKKKLKNSAVRIDSFTSDEMVDYYKGVIRPAPYKNLTFRCKIFSMNPQFQTINMSDLLVVLKDFTEEWQGEVDSSPTELALMFSVVGENPEAELFQLENTKREQEKQKAKAKAKEKLEQDIKQGLDNILHGKIKLPGGTQISI